MPITRGFLQVKKKGALKGSWTSHLCEYDPDTKLLKVKGSDNKTTLLEMGLLRAWVQDNKSNQDKYRFNVRTSDDETMTLAGSSQNDMDRWIDVFNHISEDGSDDELQTPKEVSTADVVAEAKKEVEEEADAKAELDEEFKDADKVLYHTLQDLLTSHHLGGFVLNFFNHGIDTLDSLKGCTDQFLAEQIGMKKAHVLKFRRALKDAHVDSLSSFHTIYEAPDGFRGTYDEVLEHEKKLKLLSSKSKKGKKKSKRAESIDLYEAADGFRGTYEEVVKHEKEKAAVNSNEVVEIYQSEDGKFHGSLDDVVAYDTDKVKAAPAASTNVLFRIYQSEDGKFEGTYEDVVSYEKKQQGNGQANAEEKVSKSIGSIDLYEASDGFRGTYEEVMEHQKKKPAVNSNEVIEIYQSEDGKFHGSFDEVSTYEENKENGDVICSIYESDDGKFRGAYKDVVDYEAKVSTVDATSPRGEVSGVGPVLCRIYESDDGLFHGLYEDVLAYEAKAQLSNPSKGVFTSKDGRKIGTYNEVLSYDAKMFGVNQKVLAMVRNEIMDSEKSKESVVEELAEAKAEIEVLKAQFIEFEFLKSKVAALEAKY